MRSGCERRHSESSGGGYANSAWMYVCRDCAFAVDTVNGSMSTPPASVAVDGTSVYFSKGSAVYRIAKQ
jgi:hypothetical protein